MSLVVVRSLGLATVQDLGRLGHMHEGLSNGGALSKELLSRANRAVRNPDGCACIEVLGRLIVRALAPIEVAMNETMVALDRDDELVVESNPRRVAYLAVRGGVIAPVVLGSRSAHLAAGIGEALRTDTLIESADVNEVVVPLIGDELPTGRIRVIAGPDVDAFDAAALDAFVASPYRISPTSDRVGTRLEGAVLARTAVPEVSRPMVCGAIEVPRDGQPIVLGPEHPTTGGYPVIAVIASEDSSRFFAIPLGGSVQFVR